MSRSTDFDLDTVKADAIVAGMIGWMRPWRRMFVERGHVDGNDPAPRRKILITDRQ